MRPTAFPRDVRPTGAAPPETGIARFRWVFLPVAVCALVAVGIHAAADRVDDHVLRAVDAADALLDALLGSFRLTAPLVDLVALEERTAFARGLALAWELAADLVLALPMLGIDERPGALPRFRALVLRARAHPTQLRVVRPLAAACFALAGACAAADLLRARVFVGLRETLGAAAAGPTSRIAAAAALLCVLAIAGHAVLRALERADQAAERFPRSTRRALGAGAAGSLVIAPLAAVALAEAAPLLAFFR